MMEGKDVPVEVDKLREELIWVKYYFEQYKKLYVGNELRIELLNRVASHFFSMVQRLLWYQVIIGIGRLTDQYKQGSNKNLSIAVLLILAERFEWDFADELQRLVSESLAVAKPIRIWRRKVVAHRDLPTALSNVEKLERVRIEQIEATLTAIGRALNLVYEKLRNMAWGWDMVSSHDVDALIHHLKLALIYQEKIDSARDWWQATDDWENSKYKNA